MSLISKRFLFSGWLRRSPKAVFALCLFGLLTLPLLAQVTAKRPLTAQDFDAWRNLQGAQISRDGKFVAYVMQPQDGDGELMVRNVATGAQWRSPRGYRPPTPPPDASDPAATQAFQALGRLLRPIFSADSKFLFFNIEPTKAEINKAQKEKKKPEDFPKTALGIMNLATGQVTQLERVKSYQAPEDGSGFLAYLQGAGQRRKKG